ncbi:DUF3253 domain-containing protein [Roseomonas eburnea]|uniref:DUF3253 domain-containing protein n=1 Tax=Neoroseomonas eburnea TaxID=1346889 RepID=A0A9X9X669_9PROT|nr:DUF3253 domain-containing protein [Neoroseomonas eburnea]MBR0679205.1 DUF3253 domain-containing protein [Neoroseomonas eburnea]
MSEPAIREAILAQAAACGAGKSICPSDVARALAPEQWRPLMTRVRREAILLAREGRLDILRKGKPVDPAEEIRGVIRLRIRP